MRLFDMREHTDCFSDWDIDGPLELPLMLHRDGSLKCIKCGVEVEA